MPPSPHRSRTAPRRRPATWHRAGLLVLVALLAIAAPATATTRDVEVVPVPGVPAGLRLEPVVELGRDVSGQFAWTVVVTNGGPVDGTFDLAVRELVPAADGTPQPGDAVDWAVLPRDRVVVAVGQAAHFEVLLDPPPTALPAAVALVATTRGEDARAARASLVLWPPGHQPDVGADLVEDVLRLTSDGPAPVDVAIATRAFPGRGGTTTVGPLVLLGGPRVVGFEAASSPFGQATAAVVAIDGAEVARAEVESQNWPARGVALLAVTLLAVAGISLARRARTT